MTVPALPATPQDEHDLTDALAPESPILFFRARRLLDEWTRDAAARFLVGRLEDGCWSVLHGDDGWHSIGTDAEHSTHDTARAAVAHALGGLLTEAGTGLNMKIMEMAGIVEGPELDSTDWGPWTLTDSGRRLGAESEHAPRPAADVPCIALDRLPGHRGAYIALRPEAAPEHGPYVTVHHIFELAAFRQLPEGPGEPPEELTEGSVLDCYGDTGQVFLYEPGTPFHERGIPGSADRYPHRFYRLQRPLRVHPAFPLEYTIVARGRTTGSGRGYYLVDSVADLLRDGALVETADPREETA
ncbi:TNT domain-containing protein [Actinomadura opuntiae]|uniref:TNT domain-containing protein n=1 Tax=Actinomadura sp. OS1-43 TaxID=604315 RepID=UPI00255AD88B|nr:TNT domain-containing protein [Actinomadura sp. OS1-43]MDL4814889.1 TNT domain-containing protein [Actinomadura sp. OS1-43]